MKYIIICFALVLLELSPTQYTIGQNGNLRNDELLQIGKNPNSLSLGLQGGLAFVKGEVKTQGGVGLGLGLKKTVGRFLALRLYTHVSSTKGMNHKTSTDYSESATNPWKEIYFSNGINQLDNSNKPPLVFYNYRMQSGSLILQAIFSLNDVNYATAKKNWNVFGGLGGGISGYSTKVDAARSWGSVLDPYDFVSTLYPGQIVRISTDRKDVLNNLKGILDGIYESSAEIPPERTTIQVKGNTYSLNPILSLATGFQYRLNPKLSLVAEYNIFLSSDDLLDGVSSDSSSNGLFALIQEADKYTFASLGFDFHL